MFCFSFSHFLIFSFSHSLIFSIGQHALHFGQVVVVTIVGQRVGVGSLQAQVVDGTYVYAYLKVTFSAPSLVLEPKLE